MMTPARWPLRWVNTANPATAINAAPSVARRKVKYWPKANWPFTSEASSALSCRLANRIIGAATANPSAYSPTCAGLPSFASTTTMPHWHAEYSTLPESTQVKSALRRLSVIGTLRRYLVVTPDADGSECDTGHMRGSD